MNYKSYLSKSLTKVFIKGLVISFPLFYFGLMCNAQNLPTIRMKQQSILNCDLNDASMRKRFGGISAIEYINEDSIFLVSDKDHHLDSSNVFTMNSSFDFLTINKFYDLGNIESIRFNKYLNKLFYTFEKDFTTGVGFIDSGKSKLLFSIDIPSSNTSDNRGIESITFGSDSSLWVAFESGGGTSCDKTTIPFYRFELNEEKKRYDTSTKKVYQYSIDRCKCSPEKPFDGNIGNGVSEILAFKNNPNKLLVLERCFNGKSATVMLFLATIFPNDAIIIKDTVFNFNDNITFNFKDRDYKPDNLEGMTWGEEKKDGSSTLYIVSDDNFHHSNGIDSGQKNQILILNVKNDTSKRYIRKNIHSKGALKDLEAMEKALKIMRSKDCSDPLSWYYQGAIHSLPRTIGINPLCEFYHHSDQRKEGWINCTHSKSGTEKIHFLVWHRLYIYHFEKIVRKLSGYSDFALPYWGYTDTTDVKINRTLPEIFRDTSSSLYERCRFDSLNNGYPIAGNTARVLSLTPLLQHNTTYRTFNRNIDGAPHGTMHKHIGFGNDKSNKLKFQNPITQTTTKTGLMGDFITAAFDPIFWSHHSNIDRIWQQWTNSPKGQMVTLEELKQVPWPYLFFDENGQKVEYKIEDVVKMLYNMGYDFDDTEVYDRKLEQGKNKSIKQPTLDSGVILYSKNLNIKIKKNDTKLSITNKVNQNKSIKRVTEEILIMNITVSFVNAPNGNYEIYLNLPKSEKANPESKYFTGFMTFFGADHHETMGHDHMGDGKTITTFTFEISSEVLAKDKFDISILKFNGFPNEEIIIENVTVTKI